MERSILDSALESPQACSPLIEQKPSELVARPFTVVVYYHLHGGIHGNRQCASASHNWFGWVLDARSLRLLRSRTLGRSDSGLPDISRKHHRGVARILAGQMDVNPTIRELAAYRRAVGRQSGHRRGTQSPGTLRRLPVRLDQETKVVAPSDN